MKFEESLLSTLCPDQITKICTSFLYVKSLERRPKHREKRIVLISSFLGRLIQRELLSASCNNLEPCYFSFVASHVTFFVGRKSALLQHLYGILLHLQRLQLAVVVKNNSCPLRQQMRRVEEEKIMTIRGDDQGNLVKSLYWQHYDGALDEGNHYACYFGEPPSKRKTPKVWSVYIVCLCVFKLPP